MHVHTVLFTHLIVQLSLSSKLVWPLPVDDIEAVFVQYLPLQTRISQFSLKLLPSLQWPHTSRCSRENQISLLSVSLVKSNGTYL